MSAVNGLKHPRQSLARSRGRKPWLLLLLPLAGLALSTYLWRAKIGAAELVCTALGDCITVNMSIYADIAGIPVAAAGAAMYGALVVLGGLVVWQNPVAHWVPPVGFTLSLAGAFFSLYLTGIEAFVLHAYCIWCVTSWLFITVLAFLWGRLFRAYSDGDEREGGATA